MKKRNGFTLSELLVIIAILATLVVIAGAGVFGIVQNQRKTLAYTAEVNISEAALAFYSSKKDNYMKACTNLDGSYTTISQEKVKKANDFFREEKFLGLTGEEFYQAVKAYSITGNTDATAKHELRQRVLTNLADQGCYKTITVGELIEKDLIQDNDGMCDKASIIFVYRKTDAKNTAGILTSVQEPGICKSDRKDERGPVITITPSADLTFSASKDIKVNVTTETTKLKNSFTMQYAWSKKERVKPKTWNDLEFTDNEEQSASATLKVKDLNDIKYLWIKGGTELDNKHNKTTDMTVGPYGFLASVWVSYDLNGGDPTSCPEKKQVVFSREYGKDTKGQNDFLCEPLRAGYEFEHWVYKDTNQVITDTSKVDDKTDHYLTAVWKAKPFTLTLDKNRGTSNANPSSIKVTYDSNVLDPNSIVLPNREYKVTGFGLAAARLSDGATVSSNSALTSAYSFKGWYTTEGGTTKILSEGTNPTLEPDISGYTDTNGNWKRAEGATIYAKWEENSVTLPTITKNRRICGWTKSSSGTTIEYNSGASFVPTADTVIYGVCDYCEYQISYNKNNASATNAMDNSTCKIDNNCVLRNNTFALSGYTFNGWNTASNKTGTNYKDHATVGSLASACNQTVPLYANWCQNCPANVSHGSCTLDAASTPGTCKYTTTCDAGYTYQSGQNTINPVCVPATYQITYNYNDGTAPSSGVPSSYVFGTGATVNGVPTKTGYTFEGWTGNGVTSPTSSITINNTTYGDRVFTANWKPISVQLTFDLNSNNLYQWTRKYGNRFVTVEDGNTTNFKNPTITTGVAAHLDARQNSTTNIDFKGHAPSHTSGKAYVFNGSSTYGDAGEMNNLTDITVEVIFSLTDYYEGSPLVGNAEAGGFALGIGRKEKTDDGYNYKIDFCIGQRDFDPKNRGEYDCVSYKTELIVGKKYSIAGSYNHKVDQTKYNNIKLFLNGNKVAAEKTAKNDTPIHDPYDGAHVIIGAEATKKDKGYATNDWFKGEMYSVRIYKKVLTETEIRHNFWRQNIRYEIANNNQYERYTLPIATKEGQKYRVFFRHKIPSTTQLKPTTGNTGLVIRAMASSPNGTSAITSDLGNFTMSSPTTELVLKSFDFIAAGSTSYIVVDFGTLKKDNTVFDMNVGRVLVRTWAPYNAKISDYAPVPTRRANQGTFKGWSLTNGSTSAISSNEKVPLDATTYYGIWGT